MPANFSSDPLTLKPPDLADNTYSEDALRREIRRVRELAVKASAEGQSAKESFFDDLLCSLKKTLQPIVEARQEKINEQQNAALWI